MEKTYLVSKLPKNLRRSPHREIFDIYIPVSEAHPIMRIRKNGDRFEVTKKQPVVMNDSSEQEEHTIRLSKTEYESLSKVRGRKVRKIRYDYNYKGIKAEFDVFLDDLKGLVTVDFEFKSVKEKNRFEMPDFCLADITQDKTFAGGMLCGKKYKDIKERLAEYGYEKIYL